VTIGGAGKERRWHPSDTPVQKMATTRECRLQWLPVPATAFVITLAKIQI